ncbi:MAG: acyl-[acyl-carrier-protein] thioesterase [Lachnospiraceae bacterium]|nr:acyl-[acyl-carrier-protein] thioesterase [Lachnospiraceae bacterium]
MTKEELQQYYGFESRIRYSEVNADQELTLVSLLDYFQDCSTFQSMDGGADLEYMDSIHCAWVLNMWQIDVARYPKLGEQVRVITNPYQIKSFLGYRNFAMFDEAGERIAVANTIWTLLDMDKNRPTPAPQIMYEAYPIHEKLEMEYLPRKIALPEGGKEAEHITITKHHLDTNHHVNNGQYVRMAMELLGEEAQVQRLRVEYKAQAYLEDEVTPVIYEGQESNIVALNNADGAPYAVVEIFR